MCLLSSQAHSSNRLIRVTLINSYLKGQANPLNVDNNCILTWHNSAGKNDSNGSYCSIL